MSLSFPQNSLEAGMVISELNSQWEKALKNENKGERCRAIIKINKIAKGLCLEAELLINQEMKKSGKERNQKQMLISRNLIYTIHSWLKNRKLE